MTDTPVTNSVQVRVADATESLTRTTSSSQTSPSLVRWRSEVLPVLYPDPTHTSRGATRWARGLYGLLLGLLLLAGGLLPYVVPEWTHPAEPEPTPAQLTSKASGEATWPAGTRFRDCRNDGLCPWMRVLPAGEFMMGSPEDEKGHRGNESPQRKVSIARKVAVMESEVTREQFSIFANEIKYQASSNCNWRTPGFLQTDQHPVVCISWSDAVSYARWLSSKTKKNYRLLSEMEWEFSARAGNNARWSFGESDGDICTHANIRDSGNWSTNESGDPKQAALDSLAAPATCNDQAKFTAAARSYKPNNWGLYDLHGNVWEWVNDCWRDNNTGPPSAENSQELACLDRSRTLRGGSWSFSADFSRSAARIRYVEGNRDNSTGFRLARDIDQ